MVGVQARSKKFVRNERGTPTSWLGNGARNHVARNTYLHSVHSMFIKVKFVDKSTSLQMFPETMRYAVDGDGDKVE